VMGRPANDSAASSLSMISSSLTGRRTRPGGSKRSSAVRSPRGVSPGLFRRRSDDEEADQERVDGAEFGDEHGIALISLRRPPSAVPVVENDWLSWAAQHLQRS
jgi:hypothetical protein